MIVNKNIKNAIIKERIRIGESFVDERFGGLLDKPSGNSPDFAKKSDVYKKNTAIFNSLREYITIPWGDIPEEDVDVRDNVRDIRNAISGLEANKRINVARKGITVITDKDDIISVVLANDGRGNKSTVIYYRDWDTNEDIYDVNRIKKEIDKRYSIYNDIRKSLTDAGISSKSLPDGKKEIGRATMEMCAINHLYSILYHCLSNNITDTVRAMSGSNVLNPQYAVDVLKKLYGNQIQQKPTRNPDAFSFKGVNQSNSDSTLNTIVFSTNTNDKSNFIKSMYFLLKAKHINIFEFFSNEYMKAFLKGVVIRDSEMNVKYDINTVNNINNRKKLADMCYSLRNVFIERTFLKQQSMTQNVQGIYNASRVLLLFPEKMGKMYYFDVDVKPLTDEYLKKVTDRIMHNRDERKHGNKESDLITNQRKDLGNINVDRVNKSETPISYSKYKYGYTDEAIEIGLWLKDNIDPFIKDGNLTKTLTDIVRSKRSSITYNYSEFINVILYLPGLLKYISDILNPKDDNSVGKIITLDIMKALRSNFINLSKYVDFATTCKPDDADMYVGYICKISDTFLTFIYNLFKRFGSKTKDLTINDTMKIFAKKTAEMNRQANANVSNKPQDTERKANMLSSFEKTVKSMNDNMYAVNDILKRTDFNRIDPVLLQSYGLTNNPSEIKGKFLNSVGYICSLGDHIIRKAKEQNLYEWIEAASNDYNKILDSLISTVDIYENKIRGNALMDDDDIIERIIVISNTATRIGNKYKKSVPPEVLKGNAA